MPAIHPNLWFPGNAAEAAAFYCSVFPNSRVTGGVTATEDTEFYKAGDAITVEWELDGQRFVGINGGPQFPFSEAISLEIACRDQAEVDHYWDALTADGGEESQCGWLRDRYGVSWQVTPVEVYELFDASRPERAARAMAAMMPMKKLDIAAMRAAADGA